jgi:hypothetical protein
MMTDGKRSISAAFAEYQQKILAINALAGNERE